MEKTITMPDQNESHLEPRVARLETGLETLTRNVSEMAISMREGSAATNQKIDNLVVAVTQANAPKKTDWSLFISIGFFILALGSAVFWPLNKQGQDNRDALQRHEQVMAEHMKLDMHPVGMAKVESLIKDVDINRAEMTKRDEALDNKIQRETQLMTDLITAKLVAMDQRLQVEMGLKNDLVVANQKSIENGMKAHERQDELEGKLAAAELRVVKEKNDLYVDKLFGCVQELEKERIKISDNEHAELMAWRQKAMGLSSPNATVPLLTREAVPDTTPKK